MATLNSEKMEVGQFLGKIRREVHVHVHESYTAKNLLAKLLLQLV